MSEQPNLLAGETLVTLAEAANDFGGITVPISTVRKYVYAGVQGVKLESVFINRRFTSKEAILRFIALRQGGEPVKTKTIGYTQEEVEAKLRKHKIIK